MSICETRVPVRDIHCASSICSRLFQQIIRDRTLAASGAAWQREFCHDDDDNDDMCTGLWLQRWFESSKPVYWQVKCTKTNSSFASVATTMTDSSMLFSTSWRKLANVRLHKMTRQERNWFHIHVRLPSNISCDSTFSVGQKPTLCMEIVDEITYRSLSVFQKKNFTWRIRQNQKDFLYGITNSSTNNTTTSS